METQTTEQTETPDDEIVEGTGRDAEDELDLAENRGRGLGGVPWPLSLLVG